jgi:hypothetical protein
MRNRVGRAFSVSETNVMLAVGESKQLTTTFKESGVVLEGLRVSWESSLPDIVSVDENGNVTALQRGTAIVSAYTCYKGQDFVKDVVVRSTVTKSQTTTLRLEETETNATLTELGSEKTQYGFAENETAYKYVSDGSFSARLFADGAFTEDNVPTYDRLLFKLRFTKPLTQGMTLYLANYRKGVEALNSLVTKDNCFLFYDEQGNIAKTFDVNTTYLVAIDLTKTGNGIIKNGSLQYEYGVAFMEAAEAYVGGAVLCSEDYFLDTYQYEVAEPLPDFSCVYAENDFQLPTGIEPIDGFEKYWVFQSTGTEGSWDEKMWNDRVTVGGVHVKNYRKYEYMRIDMLFTSMNMRGLYFWNGGASFSYSPSGASSGEPGDISVFIGEQDVTGRPLMAGQIYTFRIRIWRKDLENVAFGFHVNSPTADYIYLGNPMLTNY